jgi:solute carrier family 25 (adenine nucleotide translocator) protein 4/5/6/31
MLDIRLTILGSLAFHKNPLLITSLKVKSFEFVQGNFLASFFLGWSVTTVSGVCAYPFDTLRRRMMLTSGQPTKYRNALHAFHEIVYLEGFRALFRGVTANMLVGVAGAGVLAGYDQLQGLAYRHGYFFEPTQGVLK